MSDRQSGEVLTEGEQGPDAPDAELRVPPRPMPALRENTAATDGVVVFDLQNVSVDYGVFRVVRDVNLTMRSGQMTAFIGPSGCRLTPARRTT